MSERWTPEALRTVLQDTLRTVFRNPDLVITSQTTAADIKGWDSLSHVRLMIAIEKKFGVRFQAREVGEFNNIGDLLALLQAKTHAAA